MIRCLLVKGHVAVRTTTPLGDVGMPGVLGPGQVFGELALIDPAPRHGTIVALDHAPCTVPLTQEERAQLTAATRPTVNRLLRDAEGAGVLRVARGRIEVLDADALAARGS